MGKLYIFVQRITIFLNTICIKVSSWISNKDLLCDILNLFSNHFLVAVGPDGGFESYLLSLLLVTCSSEPLDSTGVVVSSWDF